MRLSIREVKAAALNANMLCRWLPETKEFRVNLKPADGGTEDTAYYTSDADDALHTLRHMALQRDRRQANIGGGYR